MSRIETKFAELKRRGEAALIPFVTAGDPDLVTTLKVLQALEKGGADCIELGIPFSDPTADGPTIQRSSERALKNGLVVTANLSAGPPVSPDLRNTRCSFRLLQSDFSLRIEELLSCGGPCWGGRDPLRRSAARGERRAQALDRCAMDWISFFSYPLLAAGIVCASWLERVEDLFITFP